MRLTAGSFRELHWHTADEWAMMLYGNARVTLLNPDGTIFIDDVSKGDLWYFPAGYPHSIQGLGQTGASFCWSSIKECFQKTIRSFSRSGWRIRRVKCCRRTSDWRRSSDQSTQKFALHFPAALPKSLAEDKAAVGGQRVLSSIQYTFKMEAMARPSN